MVKKKVKKPRKAKKQLRSVYAVMANDVGRSRGTRRQRGLVDFFGDIVEDCGEDCGFVEFFGSTQRAEKFICHAWRKKERKSADPGIVEFRRVGKERKTK